MNKKMIKYKQNNLLIFMNQHYQFMIIINNKDN